MHIATYWQGVPLGRWYNAKIFNPEGQECKLNMFFSFQIYNAGYQNIDATDASKAMLEEARKKNIFKNIFAAYLGPPLDVPDSKSGVIKYFTQLELLS